MFWSIGPSIHCGLFYLKCLWYAPLASCLIPNIGCCCLCSDEGVGLAAFLQSPFWLKLVTTSRRPTMMWIPQSLLTPTQTQPFGVSFVQVLAARTIFLWNLHVLRLGSCLQLWVGFPLSSFCSSTPIHIVLALAWDGSCEILSSWC